jgi:outer membrane protein, heavy metal efflux system
MTVCFDRHPKGLLFCALLALAINTAWAQPAPQSPATSTLKQAFEAAWLRQPEALSRQARQQTAAARRQASDSWTAEPASLELSIKTDRFNSNQGSRENEAALVIPLWLPGERARLGSVADAEVRAAASKVMAAQLRTAASVRESYWLWQRARIEQAVAGERLNNAQQFAQDVARRVKAGDLARSDQHQADGAAATAEAGHADAVSALAAASHQLQALSGTPPVPSTLPALDAGIASEPVPDMPANFSALDTGHPAVAELLDRAEVARRTTELAGVQTRANPELTLATTREWALSGEPYQKTVTLGLRIPFGSSSRNRAKQAAAQADGIEAEAQLGLERERLFSELDAARIRLESARTQVNAADKRSQLARESRSFFQKSFRLGETDLPTRLRIELEASDAERQAGRTRVDLAAAVSALRQALGLLPE